MSNLFLLKLEFRHVYVKEAFKVVTHEDKHNKEFED